MASILGMYRSAYARRPMAVQSATSSVIFGTGDLISQQLVEKRGLKNHDFVRTARFLFYGGCLFGPVATTWHRFNTKRSQMFSTPFRSIAYRVTADMTIASPFILIPMFFLSMAVLEGRPDEAIPRLQNVYFPTVARSWGVFIPAQIINYTFIPVHLQVLYFSCVSVGWSTYLSFLNMKQKKLQEKSENVLPEA